MKGLPVLSGKPVVIAPFCRPYDPRVTCLLCPTYLPQAKYMGERQRLGPLDTYFMIDCENRDLLPSPSSGSSSLRAL